jgi:hypothetical protein
VDAYWPPFQWDYAVVSHTTRVSNARANAWPLGDNLVMNLVRKDPAIIKWTILNRSPKD